MATLEQIAISRAEVQFRETGAAAVERALNSVDAAQKRVAGSAAAVETTTRQQTNTVIDATRAFNRHSAIIDPVVRAQIAIDRETRRANDALKQGADVAAQHQRNMAILTQRLEDARKASASHAQTVGLQRGAVQQLSFQLNDMATMLASGSSPFQIMATQGGQVFQVLQQGPQGVMGSLKALGSGFLGLLTPARVAGGAFAAAAAIGIAAWNSLDNKIRDTGRTLNGIGGNTGATSSTIYGAATAPGPLAFGNALQGANMFAGAGITPELLKPLNEASHVISRGFGTSVFDSQKQLAQIFADPMQGMKELAKQFGPLGVETEKQITRLQTSNKLEEAQIALFGVLADRLSNVVDTSGYIDRFTEAVKNAGSEVWRVVGAIGRTPTPQEDYLRASRNESIATAMGRPEVAEESRRRREEAAKKMSQEELRAADMALNNMARRQSYLDEELRKINELGRISAASTTARTAAEKLAIEQIRLQTEAMFDTSKAFRLREELIRAETNAIAEATKARQDYLRTVHDEQFTMGARTEREQFIRRMQLEDRNYRETQLPANRPPDSEWRSQLKYSERAGNLFTGPSSPINPFGNLSTMGGSQDGALLRALQERANSNAASTAASPPVGRQLGITGLRPVDRLPPPSNDNRPGRIDDERLAKWDKNKVDQLLFDQRVSIEAQTRALESSRVTFGQSTESIAAHAEKIRLENEIIRMGIPLTDERIAAINKVAEAEGKLAAVRERVQDQQQKMIAGMDFLRSSSNDLLSSPLKALARGEKPGEALRQAGLRIGDRMIDMGTGGITEMLMGKQGKAGFGLIGQLFGLGSGNEKTTASMDVKAGIVNVDGGLAGMGGGSGPISLLGKLFGGGGSSAGSDFSNVASMPLALGSGTGGLFAKGGIFRHGNVVPFAGGGVVTSPTLFPMAGGRTGLMGEAGDEGILPLAKTSSGALGVMAVGRGAGRGGGSASTSVSYRGGDIIVQGSVNADVMPQLESILQRNNADMLKKIKKSVPGWNAQYAQDKGAA